MERALGVVALVLALTAPAQCRRLTADTADVPDVDRSRSGAQHAASLGATAALHEPVERSALLPTPKFASPSLHSLILPSATPTGAERLAPDADVAREPHAAAATHLKHRRKIKIHDDGTLWTKLPNMKHLVEIVPIKHKSSSKGKALAYILPKSHSVDNKLKSKKRVSGVVVETRLPDSSEVSDSSEETPPVGSSESISSDSDSESVESNSSYLEDETPNVVQADDEEIGRTTKNDIVDDDNNTFASEDKINSKLNDIVSYFKEHKDVNIDSLLHDVLPDDEADPEYHVHYIIHKKQRPNVVGNSVEDATHYDEHNFSQINNKAIENDDKYKQTHFHSHSDDHGTAMEHKNHHNHVKVNEKKDNSDENLVHVAHKMHEHHTDSHHSTVHSDHEVTHEGTQPTTDGHMTPHHSLSSEYITTGDRDTSVLIESLEQLHDLVHESTMESDLNQLYEILAKIEQDPDPEIRISSEESPEVHQLHDGSDDSGQSDVSGVDWDEFSSENFSNSLSVDDINDESQSADDFENSKVEDLADGSSTSQLNRESEHDSREDLSYHADSAASEQIVLVDPAVRGDKESSEDHGGAGATAEESASSEINVYSSTQRDNGSELSASALAARDVVFPNCMKLKKKSPRKCDDGCARHKSFSLTFLFNS